MKQLKITPEIIKKANKIIATQHCLPAGYRIKVYCIEAADTYSTGGGEGVIVKPTSEKERQTRGSDKGIVVAVGPAAWKGEHIGNYGPWASVGQIVGYLNYAGKTEEEPPGSGNMYRLLNDEDPVLFFEENCNE